MAGGVVRAQRKAFDVARRAFAMELVDLRAVVDPAADASAFEVDPFVRAGERVEAATEMIFPGAEEGVEVVRAIAQGGSCLRGGLRCCGVLQGASSEGKHSEN